MDTKEIINLEISSDTLIEDVNVIDFSDDDLASALNDREDEIKEQLDELSSQLDQLSNYNSETDSYSLSEHIIETTINGLLGPFGLSQEMFQDKAGGNVTTQHNASLGIFSKESEKYNRQDYLKEYPKVASKLRNDSIVDGKFTSAYSGRTYEGIPDIDHGEALKDYHLNYGGWMQTLKQRAEFGADEKNLHVTYRGENRSLGEKDKYKWEEEKSRSDPEKTNKEVFGFDNRKINAAMRKSQKAATEHAPTTAQKIGYYAKTLGTQACQESLKLAARQALGIALKIFVEESWHIIKDAIYLYKKQVMTTVKDFINFIIAKMKDLKANIMSYLQQLGQTALQGGISGACSTIITFIINSFITTVKRIVILIREITNAIGDAIRVMIDKTLSSEEKKDQVTKIIIAALTTAVGIFLVEALKNMLLKIHFLQQYSDEIANVVVNILMGIIAVLVMYIIVRFQASKKNDERLTQINDTLFNIRMLSVERLYISQEKLMEAEYQTNYLLQNTLVYVQQTIEDIELLERETEKIDVKTQATLENIDNIHDDIATKFAILKNINKK